jgi:hypothetical protein
MLSLGRSSLPMPMTYPCKLLVGGGDDSLVITHLRADYRAGSLSMLQEKVRGKEIMLS